MKKILYLVTTNEFGGAPKYIYDLAHSLKDEYIIEVGVGHGGYQEWLDKLQSQGVKIHRLKHVVREVNPWHDFLSAFELFNLFERVQPDIIHLNSSKIGSTGAVMAWLYKKFHRRICKNLKIIYTVHGFVFNEPLSYFRKKFYIWSEKISGIFKDKLICVSEYDKIIGLNQHIADHKKFVTVHNGINLEDLNFLSQDDARQFLCQHFKLSNKDKWIGVIAGLYETKGLIYLIRAAKLLIKDKPEVQFVVIGDGPARKDLEAEIKKLELEKVFFLPGAIKKASQYIPAFDVFCLPSVKEGLAYTLIEALASGVPIVTTWVGGTLEIIEPDENGLVVEPKKPRKLVEAIDKFLDNPELTEKFKHNNLEKVKKFSLRHMVKKTKQIYDE